MKILKVLGLTILGLWALGTVGVLVAMWMYRDIPAEVLEARYTTEASRFLNVDGVRIHYRDEGTGPVVVLVHANFASLIGWDPWVEALKDKYRVIRFDMTSHGLTGPDPSEDYSRQRGTDLLDALLSHLELDKVAIAGSSTGGALAWYYAARFPDKVSALVLINAPGMPRVTNKYMETPLPDWFGYVLYLLPESLFRPFLQAPVVDKSLITDELLEEFHLMYRREGNRMAEFHRLRAWERGDITPMLERITAPVLILWGEDNPQLPVEHAEQYAEKLRNAQRIKIHIYPGVGHVIPLEIPLQSARDTAAFIEGPKLD